MRLIAVLPDVRQVGFLVDSLRNAGFDRKDLIISDLAEDQEWGSFEEAAELWKRRSVIQHRCAK